MEIFFQSLKDTLCFKLNQGPSCTESCSWSVAGNQITKLKITALDNDHFSPSMNRFLNNTRKKNLQNSTTLIIISKTFYFSLFQCCICGSKACNELLAMIRYSQITLMFSDKITNSDGQQ